MSGGCTHRIPAAGYRQLPACHHNYKLCLIGLASASLNCAQKSLSVKCIWAAGLPLQASAFSATLATCSRHTQYQQAVCCHSILVEFSHMHGNSAAQQRAACADA